MSDVSLPETTSPAPQPAERPAGLTSIPPASFRGIDCAQLARQYAAWRGLDATLPPRSEMPGPEG